MFKTVHTPSYTSFTVTPKDRRACKRLHIWDHTCSEAAGFQLRFFTIMCFCYTRSLRAKQNGLSSLLVYAPSSPFVRTSRFHNHFPTLAGHLMSSKAQIQRWGRRGKRVLQWFFLFSYWCLRVRNLEKLRITACLLFLWALRHICKHTGRWHLEIIQKVLLLKYNLITLSRQKQHRIFSLYWLVTYCFGKTHFMRW